MRQETTQGVSMSQVAEPQNKASKSSRSAQRDSAKDFLDNLTAQQFPNSRKVYLQGEHPGVNVGVREICLGQSLVGGDENNPVFEPNEPLQVYDTAGPYSDPDYKPNVRDGLPKLRQQWIEARGDSEILETRQAAYSQKRMADQGLDHIRFDNLPAPRKAKAGKNVTQMHYARQGIITPEMEFIAIRENMGRAALAEQLSDAD